MTEQAPDLVLRAAARLQQSRSDVRTPPIAGGTGEPAPRTFGQTIHVEENEKALPPVGPPPASPRCHQTISPGTLAANGLALPSNGFSRTTEEFRALKRYMLAKFLPNADGADGAAARVILVTSARAGEGKTFTAINLALALAYEKDTRVLLMDADAYRQSLMTYLGVSAEAGWLDLVSGRYSTPEEVVLGTNISGLSILPSGKQRAEIPELMASRLMKRLLEDLARDDPKRIIIMDALPCLTSTEPSILGALAGQTLFVVAAHKTSREDVESSLRLLHTSSSVSLVLNKAEPLLAEQFKGYGYAYSYQH